MAGFFSARADAARAFERAGAVTGDASPVCRVGRPRFLATAAARPWFRYLQFSQFSGRGPRFVLWRLARRLGLHPRVQWVKNYQAYAIAGAVFERSWWLRLWSPEQDRLNEGVQLAAAIRSLIEDPLLTVGYVEPAVARTSIKTSAMEDAQQGRPDFAVSVMNQALNEAWLRGGWTVGGPSAVDLDVDSVVGVFASAGLPQAFAEQWIGWWSAVEANYDRVGFPLAP